MLQATGAASPTGDMPGNLVRNDHVGVRLASRRQTRLLEVDTVQAQIES